MLDSVVVVVIVVVWWWWWSLWTSVERSCWRVLTCLPVRDGWMESRGANATDEWNTINVDIWSKWICVVVVYRYTVSMVTARNANACFCEAGRMQREMGLWPKNISSTKSFVQAVPRDSSRQYIHLHICRSIFTFEYRSVPRTTPLKILLSKFLL